METNIICPNCITDMNSYKCEYTCNYCDTIYCLLCNEPFYIINFVSYKGHRKMCYINNKLAKL